MNIVVKNAVLLNNHDNDIRGWRSLCFRRVPGTALCALTCLSICVFTAVPR